MRWSLRRLRGFAIVYPDVEIRLSITERFVDFVGENVDIAIPFEGGLARLDGYYVVGKAAARNSLHVGTLWQWLLAEARDGIIADAPAPEPP